MSDRPDDTEPTTPFPHEDTRPLPSGPPTWTPTAPPPPPYAAPPVAMPAARSRGRAGLAAAVLASAVIVGGAAGLGGAAVYDAFDDDPVGSPGSSQRTTSNVVDTPDEPAAKGSVEAVAAEVLPSVVKIDVAGSEGGGSGSGIILSADGQILTNEHVVAVAGDGGEITVSFDDGSRAPAEILGTDPLTDTAVIQAQDVEGLEPASIGVSGDLRVGEQVVAIGSPFGLESTVTTGIVSALNRPVDVGSDAEGNTTTYPAIQTDAAINPGNSGGPLVDMDGNVVGINSSIRTASSPSPFGQSESGGSIGLGFAIPMDPVLPIIEQMAEGETPTHARLGIQVSDVGMGELPGPEDDERDGAAPPLGALVREVGDGSAAEEAGLRPDDVIVRVDDQLISGADSLVATIRTYRPGDEVEVTYERDGEEDTVTLTLDSDAEETSS